MLDKSGLDTEWFETRHLKGATMFTKTTAKDQLIMQWHEAQQTLAQAKEVESQLRKEVLAECFAVEADFEGTENVDLGEGYKLKSVFKLNRRLANKNGETDKALTKIEKLGEAGEFVADRLVKWEPKLSMTEYKKLPNNMRKIIDEVITAAPGAPSISLVEPKAKK